MHIDARLMPTYQAMNSECVSQIIWSRTDAASQWFESPTTQHATQDSGCTFNGECFSVGTYEERSVGVCFGKAITVTPIFPELE